MHLPFYANPISNNETKIILKERLRNECLELKSEFGEISREHLHRAVYAKACLKVNSLKNRITWKWKIEKLNLFLIFNPLRYEKVVL